MIHRLQRGTVPATPHTVFKPDGELAYEHCLTRRGFEGAYTIMYHRKPPHWVREEEDLGAHPGAAEPTWDGAVRRRHFLSGNVPANGDPFASRHLLLANADLGVWIARPDRDDPTLVANADADELTFVHQGSGRVESPLGVVHFSSGDYVYMPRALPHRWRLAGPTFLLVLEARSWIDVPHQFRNPSGQLRMDAPYTHRDFKEPEWPEGGPATLAAPRELKLLRRGRVSRVEWANDPFDVIGWDGQVWPFAFPIRAYKPKTGMIHLPPTTHITFAGGGFVVCSFVPRMLDWGPQAIPCPYPHSSVDCDEVIFYVEGQFTSRRGVGPASLTLHPVGVPHGPHPGRYENSVGVRRTDELAVMFDTFAQLLPTDNARAVEDPGYNRGWVEGTVAGVME